MQVYHPSPSLSQIHINPQDKQNIKDAGHDLKCRAGCSECHQFESDDVKLMKCAKCKIALYCSKNCQKMHWPSHKSECKLSADQKVHALMDLVNYFLGNKFLHSYLELAVILELGLVESTVAALEKRFSVQFYVGIEPCDIHDFQRIWSPKYYPDPSKDVKMKGMFQLLGLTTSSTQPRDAPRVHPRLPDSRFADSRRKANELGHPWDPLVECEFVGITDQFITSEVSIISISAHAFALAQTMKMITVSEGIHKPLTVATCLEFINMQIRQDIQDRFYLRSMMKLGNVKLINYTKKDVGSEVPFIIQAKKALQEKVKRESVYAKYQ